MTLIDIVFVPSRFSISDKYVKIILFSSNVHGVSKITFPRIEPELKKEIKLSHADAGVLESEASTGVAVIIRHNITINIIE